MIEDITSRQTYDISDVQVPSSTGYEIPFPYPAVGNVYVYITSYGADAFVSRNDYTVDETGATPVVKFRTGYVFPAGHTKLTVMRNVSLRQKLDLRNGDIIDADKLEEALDDIVEMVQQVNDQDKRAVKGSVSDIFPIIMPSADERAGKLLGFDSLGMPSLVLTRDVQQKLDQALEAEESAIRSAGAAKGYMEETKGVRDDVSGIADGVNIKANQVEERYNGIVALVGEITPTIEAGLGSINEAKGGALSEISAARSEATNAITEAQAAAVAEVGGAKSQAVTVINTSRTNAVQAVNETKSSAQDAVNLTKERAIDAVNVSKATAVADLTEFVDGKKGEISDFTAAEKVSFSEFAAEERANAVQSISDIRDEVVAAVVAEGTTQKEEIQAVYQGDLNLIRDDVGQLNSHLTELSNDTYRKAEVDEKVAEATPSDYEALKREVREQNYRLDNLEVLSDHMDYHEETVNGLLEYPKTVDTAEWAEVEEVYGKSVVWNQLIAPDAFSDYSKNGVQFSKQTDGTVLITEVGSRSEKVYSRPLTSNPSVVAGHVYLSLGMYDNTGNIPALNGNGSLSIATCSTSGQTDFRFYIPSTLVLPISSRVGLVDLTQLFGEGNEPTSIDDPRITWVRAYATAHPEYDRGSLHSSRDVQVKSEGANLWDVRITKPNTNGSVTVTPNGDVFTISGNANGLYPVINYDFDEPFLKKGMIISASIEKSVSTVGIRFRNKTDGSYVTLPFVGTTLTFDVDRVQFYTQNTFSGTATIRNIMVVKGSESKPYTPHLSQNVELPKVVLRGIGSVRDTYNPRTGKVMRRIGVVDLGTLIWDETWSTKGMYESTTGLADAKSSEQESYVPNAICSNAKVTSVTNLYSGTVRPTPIYGVSIRGNQGNKVYARYEDDRIPDGILYYELATPVEEDVGTVEPWLVSEKGGTVTVLSEEAQAEAMIHFQTKKEATA